MNSDIEILDIREDSPIPEGNAKILNILTEDLDDDDDEDIICLDTVFKPVEKTVLSKENTSTISSSHDSHETRSSLSDLQQSSVAGYHSNTPVIVEKETMHQQLTSRNSVLMPGSEILNVESCVEVVTDEVMQSTIPINSLSSEEECIDDILSSTPNTSKHSHSANEGLHSIQEPPLKKFKSKKNQLAHPRTTSSNELSVGSNLVKPQKCTFAKPPDPFLNLVVLILRNTKCLLCHELWDYVSGMFPYFEYNLDVNQGMNKIKRLTAKYSNYFLKTTSDVIKSNRKLIMLNPLTIEEQDAIVAKTMCKKEEMMLAMFTPENFHAFVRGTLSLTSVNLLHIRPRSQVKLTNTKSKKLRALLTAPGNELSDPLYIGGDSTRTASDASKLPLSANQVIEAQEVHVVEDAEDGKSDTSTDTIVFDPKIVNCRTLQDDEIENDISMAQNLDIQDASSGAGNEQGLTILQIPANNFSSELLNQLDINTSFHASGFENTVWSSEEAITVGDTQTEGGRTDNPRPDSEVSFPEVEKCVPRWKQIFPWVSWKPWLKNLVCNTCQDIHNKINSEDRAVVMSICHPDDVFKVSKQLRAHSEKLSHKMATILSNKHIISTLYFLMSSHFNEFGSIAEILSAFDDLLGENFSISQDILKCTIQMLGQYLEDRIIAELKKVKKFSIITDPCAGLLVVRWVNSKDEPEEHIISSFSNSQDKTPCDYLSSLGISVKLCCVYVTNSRCEECARCKHTKKAGFKNKTPLRLPQLDRYLLFLWRTKVLKPFYAFGSTLTKLWVNFPHKFTDVKKFISFEKLTQFPSNPDCFIEIIQNFDKFKEIVSSIYALTGGLDALGFISIDISKFSWILDFFPILTNINILLTEIKVVYPFAKEFDDLFHNVEKLKQYCEKIKESIKAKKLTTPGVSSADIDDFFFVVDLTIKEFQQPIYHKGKCVALSYGRLNCAANLEKYLENEHIRNSFTILCTAIKGNFRYENTIFLKSYTKFLQEHKTCEKKNSEKVLKYFSENKNLAKDHVVAYTFYRLISLFAFQPATMERCLYEIKVYDYLFYRSAWSSIGGNVKSYLLTIISEMSDKSLLSEKDMQLWWKNNTSQTS